MSAPSQLAAALEEIAATIRQGVPAFSVAASPGNVMIICSDPLSAERWKRHVPNNLLPETLEPVQVLVVDVYATAGGAS